MYISTSNGWPEVDKNRPALPSGFGDGFALAHDRPSIYNPGTRVTRMKHAYALAALGILTMLAATQAAERAPVPTAEQQAKAAKTVEEIFGRDVRASRTVEQSRALARRMLQAAADSNDDAAGRFALLVRTRAIAAQAGDVKTAVEADEQLDRTYAVSDPASERATLLEQLAKTVRPGPDVLLLIDQIDSATERALARDDYDLATRSADLAIAAAAHANDPAVAHCAAARAKDVRDIRAAYIESSTAMDTIRKDPDDRQAALAAGRFVCFMKGDWAHGLILLRSGADAGLAALARDELRGPADSPAQIALADSWWDIAGAQPEGVARRQVHGHAAAWYRTALPSAGGLSKAKRRRGSRRPGRPPTRSGLISCGALIPCAMPDVERGRF